MEDAPERRLSPRKRSGITGRLIGSDINDGDNRSINFILQRPVGKYFELIMNAHAIRKLPFQRVKIRDDLQNQRLQVRDFDRGMDIGKWAANVAGN